jgi:hypothetical protein
MPRKPTKAASAAARALAALRTNPSGGRNGGRPRSDAPRCACGAMTLKRAEARGKSSEHNPACAFYRERALFT